MSFTVRIECPVNPDLAVIYGPGYAAVERLGREVPCGRERVKRLLRAWGLGDVAGDVDRMSDPL